MNYYWLWTLLENKINLQILIISQSISRLSSPVLHTPRCAGWNLKSIVTSKEPFNRTSRNMVWSGRCHDATQSDIKSAAWTDSSSPLSWWLQGERLRAKERRGDWAPVSADLLDAGAGWVSAEQGGGLHRWGSCCWVVGWLTDLIYIINQKVNR